MAVLTFGDRRVPTMLHDLPLFTGDDEGTLDAAIAGHRRLIVTGNDADLATVLRRLLRTSRLDIEVGYAPARRSPATRLHRIPAGRRGARRARFGAPRRVPLIRDETGSVIVGRARWLPPSDNATLHGEAVADDTQLFDGDVAGVLIEPTTDLPGARARVLGPLARRWVSARAVQLGSNGVIVERDGVPATRPARRSTFYRNTEGWLLVR